MSIRPASHRDVKLRALIGVVGILLPIVLIGVGLAVENQVLSSLSAYYHSKLVAWFVGSLCVIGMFLYAYRGYDEVDRRWALRGAFAAVGVALFPIQPDNPVDALPLAGVLEILHLASAGAFFGILGFFCLRQFTQTDPNREPSEGKGDRNRVYRACGWGIVACLVGIAIYKAACWALDDPALGYAWRPVTVFESVAIGLFAISWFVKGKAWRASTWTTSSTPATVDNTDMSP